MKIRKGLLLTGIAAALLISLGMAPSAEAAARVIVRPGFGFYYGPGPGWYYRPWGRTYVVAPAPVTGDVKISSEVKGESIYVDGGFAGTTGKLKKFALQPGNHRIEIRDAEGRVFYQNTIRVIAGQTVEVKC
jgi:PEGA domain-containing protein